MGTSYSVYDGYLNTNIDGDSAVVIAIRTSFISIALVIQCVIASLAMFKMKQYPDIDPSTKICFFASVICAFCFTIVSIIQSCTGMDNHLLSLIFALSAVLFYWCLLVTFITRLYITFKPSAYKMSSKMRNMFIAIMILNAVSAITMSVYFTFYFNEIHRISYSIIGVIWWLSYVIGCMLAVYFFISNLSKLAKLRAHSLQNVHCVDDVSLDAQQQKLSHLSAKYAMLFVISIGSTILNLSVFITSVNIDSGLGVVFGSLDFCLNLWCLYLQFSFARQHYNRCCRCCDECCSKYAHKRTRSLIYKHSILTSKSSEMSKENHIAGEDESKPLDPALSDERSAKGVETEQ